MSGKRAAPWIFLMWSSSERMTVVVRVFINRWWPHSEQHQRPMGALNSTSLLSLSFWGWKWSNCGSSERARWIFSCCLVCRVHAELTVRRVRLQLRFSGNLSWPRWILFIFNASEGEGALRTLSCSFCQNQTLLPGWFPEKFILSQHCFRHSCPFLFISCSSQRVWTVPLGTTAPHSSPETKALLPPLLLVSCLFSRFGLFDQDCVYFGHFASLRSNSVTFWSFFMSVNCCCLISVTLVNLCFFVVVFSFSVVIFCLLWSLWILIIS